VFAIATVAVVLLNRKAMLTRDQAVSEVLYPGEESSPEVTHDPPGRRPDQCAADHIIGTNDLLARDMCL
jgi:hypothetical protein